MDELAMDRPTATELLEIIAETLSETVVPATAPHAQHQARVAANLCRVLGRELATGDPTVVDLPDSLIDATDEVAAQAHTDVVEMVRAKLAVVKPGYDSHGSTEERNIVS